MNPTKIKINLQYTFSFWLTVNTVFKLKIGYCCLGKHRCLLWELYETYRPYLHRSPQHSSAITQKTTSAPTVRDSYGAQSSYKRYTLYINCVDEIGILFSVKSGGTFGYHWALNGQVHTQDAWATFNYLTQHKGLVL